MPIAEINLAFEEDKVGWCRLVHLFVFGLAHENYSCIPKRNAKWTYKSDINVAVPFATKAPIHHLCT